MRNERLVWNPAFVGVLEEMKPSQFGFAMNEFFPETRFQSNGNGQGLFLVPNNQDNFQILDEEFTVRRPGAAANKIKRTKSMGTFTIERRHLDSVVADDEAKLFAQQSLGGVDLHVTEATWVRELMFLQAEKRAATLAATNGAVGGNTGVAKVWSDPTSDPIPEIIAAIKQVKQKSGLAANTIAMNYSVALALAAHPKIHDKRGSNERQNMTPDGLAELLKAVLGLNKVVIINSVYVPTRKEGESLSLSELWGNHCWIWHQASSPSLVANTWGVRAIDTFYYEGGLVGVYDIRDDDTESTFHRVKEDSDNVIINKDCAYRLNSVI